MKMGVLAVTAGMGRRWGKGWGCAVYRGDGELQAWIHVVLLSTCIEIRVGHGFVDSLGIFWSRSVDRAECDDRSVPTTRAGGAHEPRVKSPLCRSPLRKISKCLHSDQFTQSIKVAKTKLKEGLGDA